jgi:hypothetical protein
MLTQILPDEKHSSLFNFGHLGFVQGNNSAFFWEWCSMETSLMKLNLHHYRVGMLQFDLCEIRLSFLGRRMDDG